MFFFFQGEQLIRYLCISSFITHVPLLSLSFSLCPHPFSLSSSLSTHNTRTRGNTPCITLYEIHQLIKFRSFSRDDLLCPEFLFPGTLRGLCLLREGGSILKATTVKKKKAIVVMMIMKVMTIMIIPIATAAVEYM